MVSDSHTVHAQLTMFNDDDVQRWFFWHRWASWRTLFVCYVHDVQRWVRSYDITQSSWFIEIDRWTSRFIAALNTVSYWCIIDNQRCSTIEISIIAVYRSASPEHRVTTMHNDVGVMILIVEQRCLSLDIVVTLTLFNDVQRCCIVEHRGTTLLSGSGVLDDVQRRNIVGQRYDDLVAHRPSSPNHRWTPINMQY